MNDWGEKLKGGVCLEFWDAIVTIQVSHDIDNNLTWPQPCAVTHSTTSIYLHKQTFSEYTTYGQRC